MPEIRPTCMTQTSTTSGKRPPAPMAGTNDAFSRWHRCGEHVFCGRTLHLETDVTVRRFCMKRRIPDVGLVALLLCVFAGATMSAEDWPRHRGKGDLGIWTETGIVETFPPNGLPVRWRKPINGGYSAPAVVAGRVFVSDFIPGKGAAPAEGPGGGGTSANPRIGGERRLA